MPASQITRSLKLPSIDSYDVPDASRLPTSRVNWSIDPSRAILLVHDMQEYFLDPFPDGSAPLNTVLPAIASLQRAARQSGVPVVFTAQPAHPHPDDRGLLTDFWGEGLAKAPHRREIAADLAPMAGEVVLTKWRYSAFRRSDLIDRMHAAGRDQLLITGVYAHIGCLATALDAFMSDLQPFLIADAMADFSAEDHHRALEWAAQCCAVVIDTRDAGLSLRTAESANVQRAGRA